MKTSRVVFVAIALIESIICVLSGLRNYLDIDGGLQHKHIIYSVSEEMSSVCGFDFIAYGLSNALFQLRLSYEFLKCTFM